MGLSFLIAFAAVSFAINAAAQFPQTTTTDPNQNNKRIYVAGGSTSSVAAPQSTPTLVYNCYWMPLICENVADYAKTINPGGNGDLGGVQLFHFDPDTSKSSPRRKNTCGCFNHDSCSTAISQGKRSRRLVTDFANDPPFNNLNQPMSPQNKNLILKGSNPSTKKGVLQQRVPLPNVPGRFYGMDGVAFSCDEFPAATWIEGGTGDSSNGKPSKTVCAMQSLQIYTDRKGAGKWPFVSGSGERREQDWQASAHGMLRVSYRVPALTAMANQTLCTEFIPCGR